MLKHPTFDFFFSYFHVLQKCAHVSDAGLGIFRLGSSVNSTWKKEGKNENKNSMTYLSVNSVNGSDIEIINTISLAYFLK